jgi:cell division septation protein DedD
VLKRAAFSVQVGLFLEEIDADRLVEELKSLGYRPTIFVGYDSERRPWYSVRIGSYAEQAEAAQAASKFTEKEKIKAVVRPASSL